MLYQLSYSRFNIVGTVTLVRVGVFGCILHGVTGLTGQRAACYPTVGRGGFEPPKAKPADLQSAPVDRFGTDPYVAFSLKYVHLCRCPTQHRISMKSPLAVQQIS